MTLLSFALVVVFVLSGVLSPGSVDAQPRPSSKSQQLMPAGPVARPGQPAPPVVQTPAAAAVTTPTLTPPAASGATAPLPSDYVIGPGDVLQVSIWKNETLSRIVPVRPDGKISLPLLHDVQAAGLTAMQLRDKLANALAEFLPNPEVAVSVNEVHSLRVSILGEVQRPGVLELRGKITILEAIAMAGGFRDFASPSKITVIRTDDKGQSQKIRFNYNKAISSSSDEPNMVLNPGDVIVVP
jgi:polysaccharide export outer membrane protein